MWDSVECVQGIGPSSAAVLCGVPAAWGVATWPGSRPAIPRRLLVRDTRSAIALCDSKQAMKDRSSRQ